MFIKSLQAEGKYSLALDSALDELTCLREDLQAAKELILEQSEELGFLRAVALQQPSYGYDSPALTKYDEWCKKRGVK